MTEQEAQAQAQKDAAAVARHEADTTFLRRVGIALEAKANELRAAGHPPLDLAGAVELITALGA